MAYSSSGWAAASSLEVLVEVLEVLEVEVEVVEVVARRARFLVGAILRLPSLLLNALRDNGLEEGVTAMTALTRGGRSFGLLSMLASAAIDPPDV